MDMGFGNGSYFVFISNAVLTNRTFSISLKSA